MRRISITLVLLTLIIGGLFIYNHTRDDRWRKLPWGGEIRWVDTTYERPPMLHFKTKESFLAPLWKWLGPKWRYRFAERAFEAGGSMDTEQIFVWFQVRGDVFQNAYASDNNAHLLGTRDQLIPTRSGFTSSRPGGRLVGLGFNPESCTQPRIRIRWSRDEQTMDFDIANPFYSLSKKQ